MIIKGYKIGPRADLCEADLRWADLREVVGLEQTVITPEGDLIVYKKLMEGSLLYSSHV